MIKILLIEKKISDRILIQSYLPDCCTLISILDPAEASGILEKSLVDVVIAGPSVHENHYVRLSRAAAGQRAVGLLSIFSRDRGAERAAEAAFGCYPNLRTIFSIMPSDSRLIEGIIAEIISRKLGKISGGEDDCLFNRMSMLIGESAPISRLKSDILRYSTAPGPVLISGESGTGKEIVARLIHDFSYRSEKLYYALNAGAIPSGLSESELFGAEAGAYTGAVKRKGCFEYADGGTLFLDEVGELDKDVQVEFLRVLETGRVRRVGGNKQVKTDVRLVTATNKNLNAAVRAGSFRQDLLFRINVFQIKIPPLRDHKEDIPDLLRHFSGQLRSKRPDKCYMFSDSFINGLFEHDWPGNIRELRNVFHRAVYASDSEVLTAESLQFDNFNPD
ncbi:MAG: sigma-54-dependent Fis family transcriptional regulator [Spirochaetales bacterium]|nr:sigma-54-dependent Fis family transcriptional regulator [Spirochaetales bacterium]